MQRPVLPSWLVAGFVTAAIGLGPVAQSSAGARIGNWFRGIGETGRAVAIVVFALAMWGAVFALEPSLSALSSAVAGAVAALALYTILFVILSGSIEGWTTPLDGS
ncbi:hypothetical protein [Natranaeroarchaeum aerophilus]|uniref:Uncharacterized protein n=1 Tax=Natranaeroarchaeum aerophilus TaxID=2917711 RepID=A0AAE3FT14_9EURY|nr:hypothetical protein [Natranaeroarchaeum aerophilus]MCL9814520.1 hypothetical protein [Natranaeroarchaeum aerophilus]